MSSVREGEGTPFHCSTISRINGIVKVAPVLAAKKTKLSNCLNGRMLEYGPSINTDLPLGVELFDGRLRLGYAFSAYLKKRFVAPFLARTMNSSFPSWGREEIVKGWEESGATTWQARNMCWPAFQAMGGLAIITRV